MRERFARAPAVVCCCAFEFETIPISGQYLLASVLGPTDAGAFGGDRLTANCYPPPKKSVVSSCKAGCAGGQVVNLDPADSIVRGTFFFVRISLGSELFTILCSTALRRDWVNPF